MGVRYAWHTKKGEWQAAILPDFRVLFIENHPFSLTANHTPRQALSPMGEHVYVYS